MFKTKSRILAIAIISVFILVVISGLLLSSSSKKGGFNPNSGEYYDKNSGETVSNPPGKGPDTYGTASGAPIYLGVSSLLDSGLTYDQLTKVKYAFSNYFTQNKKTVHEVSVNVNSITHGPRRKFSSDPYSDLFNVTFDRKDTYKVRIEYTGLDDVRLYLYNQKTDVQVYDSGVLNGNTAT
jgi:hypothetical protein